MASYFKTQWWRLLCACLCLIYAFVIGFTSTATADTVEGVYLLLGDVVRFGSWFLASCFWVITSYTYHNSDCIQKLNQRVTELENRAITDIDEVSKNNFMVKRRLGLDKEAKDDYTN